MLFVTQTFYKLDARIYQIHKYQKCRNEVYYEKNKKIKEHVNSLLFFLNHENVLVYFSVEVQCLFIVLVFLS